MRPATLDSMAGFIKVRFSVVASRPRVGCYSQARTSQLVWASWTGTAGQGPAIRTRQVLDRQGFHMCISICSSPGRIGSNKQRFHNQYMHTCLLRATSVIAKGRVLIRICFPRICPIEPRKEVISKLFSTIKHQSWVT